MANWRPSTLMAGAFVLALALLVFDGVISYLNTQQLIEQSELATHSRQVLASLESLRRNLTDAESSHRGFILTDEERFLEPYTSAVQEIPKELTNLRNLTAQNPKQQQRLEKLNDLISRKMNGLKERIELRRSKGLDAARIAIITGRGEEIMQEFRAGIREMRKEENESLGVREASSQSSARTATLTSIAGTVVASVLMLGVSILLSREVRQRERAEAELRGLAKVTRDLTEQKSAESTLVALLEAVPEAMVVTDGKGRIVRINARTEKLFGYSRDELMGQPVEALVPERFRGRHIGHREGYSARPSARPMGGASELFALRKDGSEFPVEIGLGPVETRSGHLVVATIQDITARKRAEETVRNSRDLLEQRTAQLEATNLELEGFTHSVAHDLRSPLRHVDGFSKILLEEFQTQLAPEAQRYLERIRTGTQKMGHLVDDLLNLARVGRQELTLQVSGLNSIVEEVLPDLKPETAERQIEWKISKLPFVECDPALMKQVFANLLSNAIKFTRTRDRALIEVGDVKRDGRTAVFVRDNGVGFNMKYADKLFGVFQRLHRAEDFEGTGVGLATVQRIIHKHGGQVWAEAELDKGATFYFSLGNQESIPQKTSTNSGR